MSGCSTQIWDIPNGLETYEPRLRLNTNPQPSCPGYSLLAASASLPQKRASQ